MPRISFLLTEIPRITFLQMKLFCLLGGQHIVGQHLLVSMLHDATVRKYHRSTSKYVKAKMRLLKRKKPIFQSRSQKCSKAGKQNHRCHVTYVRRLF
jgi:hypothetical protein